MIYTPNQLNLPFKEVRRISVGSCMSRDPEHTYQLGGDWFRAVLGHAHMCPNDPYRKSICILEKFVTNRQIMWHEYAHILTPMPAYILECGVEDGKSERWIVEGNAIEVKKAWNDGHSKEWADWMRSFGLEPNIHYMGEP